MSIGGVIQLIYDDSEYNKITKEISILELLSQQMIVFIKQKNPGFLGYLYTDLAKNLIFT